MTWFDFGVLVVLVVSIGISLLHGLAREMVSLGVWVGGFILATLFGGHVAGSCRRAWAAAERADRLLIVFGVVLVVGWIVGLALSSAVRASGLAPADRALGSVFGLVRGLIIVLVVVLLAGLTPLRANLSGATRRSRGRSRPAVLALRPYMPRAPAQRLRYR